MAAPTVVGVYAKTLIPGPNPVPALMATTDELTVLLPQLLERGWALFGDPPPLDPAGEVVIDSDRLRLVLDGRALLDDRNPTAPDGWWAAVDQLGSRCAVILCDQADVDLVHHAVEGQLAALVDTARAVFAALPVTTVLAG